VNTPDRLYGLDARGVMGLRTYTADPRSYPRHLLERSAFDEFFESPKLRDHHAGIMDFARVVQV
jgi:hypothetical protein